MFSLTSLLLFFIPACWCDLTTNYYEELIKVNQLKAREFTLPQSNSEFKLGVESTKQIADFGIFDFVIVGAGTAGSVLATRLTEITNWRVLILEAGNEENDYTDIPNMAHYLQFSEFNWGYYSTRQNNSCLGMVDQKCITPRGKAIGGSSTINYLLYTRGDLKDYKTWGWSSRDVTHYFKKSEFCDVTPIDRNYHGFQGEWNVESPDPLSPIFADFVGSNLDLNRTYIDYNGKDRIGFSKCQMNTAKGKRGSTGRAFLDRAAKRENLKIVTKALVTKIIIVDKIARGVEFVTDNQKFRAYSNLEVIISAGAINTPELLMLSGVGPRTDLERLGVKVIQDLPVGENLIEHPDFFGLIFHTNLTIEKFKMADEIQKYVNEGRGLLTNTIGLNGLGYLQTSSGTTVEYVFIPPTCCTTTTSISDRLYNLQPPLIENFLNRIDPTTDIQFHLVLLQSKSRGRVTLKSNNPLDFPDIDLNMFSDRYSEDINNVYEAIKFVVELMQTKRFQKINATLIEYPICKQYKKLSKKFWECLVRHLAATTYHPCGTTKIGTVVNENLKVNGIEKLRIVDAGVIPEPISGHINAPVVMMAEKIADVIKCEYNKFCDLPNLILH